MKKHQSIKVSKFQSFRILTLGLFIALLFTLTLGLFDTLTLSCQAYLSKSNFAYTTTTSTITDAAGEDSTFTVATGEGARFPSTGEFLVVAYSPSCSVPSTCAWREIIRIKSRSGDIFTIKSRNQEGSTHTGDWASGSKIDNTITAGSLDEVVPVVDANRFLTINAAVAYCSSTPSTLWVTKQMTLVASLTTPSTLETRIDKGGGIVKASTYTLTINGPFEAGLYQVFSGFGAGDITGLNEPRPEWYGGIGDDSTDCTSAFAQAEATASAGVVAYGQKKNIVLSTGTYRVTSTPGTYAITVHCPIVGEGPYVSIIKNVGTGSALSIKGVTGEIHDSHFSGFSVKGNASSEDGIVLNEGYDLLKAVGYSIFDNVYSVYHGRHGLVHRASWGTKYNNCKFDYNGGLGVYLQAAAGAGESYHNNIIFTNCDARWNGGTGNVGTDFLKGGVRLSGNGEVIFWNGGVVESNNAWGFILGHDTTSVNSYINLIKIEKVHMENTPTTSGTSTVGGLFHVDEIYGSVEANNNFLSYVAPAGGTGYAFYVNHVPEVGKVFKEWGNQVESSGLGTATRDYGLTYDWSKPLVSNILEGGDTVLLTAASSGKWQIGGFIHVHNIEVDDVGIFPWTAAYDSVAGLTTHVGSSLITETLTNPTLTWSGTYLKLSMTAGYYGFVEMKLGTGKSPPTILSLPVATTRDKTTNGNFDSGDTGWTKDAGWTIVDQGGGDYEAVATNASPPSWIYQTPTNIVIGKTYRVDIVCTNYTDGSVAPLAYGGVMGEKYGTQISATGTASLFFVAEETSIFVGAAIRTANSDLRVDNIALYEQSVWPDDLVKRSYSFEP